MTTARQLASVSVIAMTIALGGALTPSAAHADAILSGTVTASTGEKLNGVAVSAKAEGTTITYSVYTDEAGAYYFPPLPSGNYRVWTNVVKFETGRGNVAIAAAHQRRDFSVKPITDQEAWIKQLPGDEFLAALPGETPEDFRMKTQVRKNCTGCHSASYPLQHRFDADGWHKVLDLMKQVNVSGVYPRPDKQFTQNIDFHQKELAAYLARARGPGQTSLKFNLQPRITGEPARVFVKEYDVPNEEGHFQTNDGTDWMLGTPSETGHMAGVHDTYADFDGNMWFTYSRPSQKISVGRVDAKTGETKFFALSDTRGIVAGSHGITRDENGYLWFNTRSHVQRARGGLAKIDPKTHRITVYQPAAPMSGTSGTADADMRGNIWVTAPDGAFRFNIAEEKFTEFKSVTYKNARGTATVYGLAADSMGNGWWLLMTQDLVNYSDITTGKTHEFALSPEEAVLQNLTPEQRAMYDKFVPPDFNAPLAWAQSPRRMGADHNGDFVWIGNSFGGTMAQVNVRTKEVTMVSLPNPEAHQPYQVTVDNNHNVWTNLWSTDKIAKYDPSAKKWTLFELPNRGTETRHISLLERPGQPLQVIVPYYRTRKIAVMTPRSEADIEALKKQAAQ